MHGPGVLPVLGVGEGVGVGVVVVVVRGVLEVTGILVEGGREVVDTQMLKCLSTVPLGPQTSQ